MSLTLQAAKVLLPLLFLAGVGGLHYMSIKNGFFALISQTIESEAMSGSKTALRTHWTGVKAIDDLAVGFLCFFLPLFDGKHPSYSLQGFQFTGQYASFWILVVTESFRGGNKDKAVSNITFWGILAEFGGIGIAMPAFCFFHLLTSPTVSLLITSGAAARKSLLQISERDLMVLPWSTALGHGIPIAMAFFTSADVISPIWQSQQFWVVIRIFHPVFTVIIHSILSQVLPQSVSVDKSRKRGVSGLRPLQVLLDYASYVAMIPHIAAMTVIVCSQGTNLFTAGYTQAFNPYLVFQPRAFWHAIAPVTTVGEGAMAFLQWDAFNSCSAVLVWAMALNREGLRTRSEASSFFTMLWRTSLMLIVGGPSAAAISLIKERDFILLDEVEEGKPIKSD